MIIEAFEEAIHLISEEYQSVIDDDLRQNYDRVLKKLKIAIGQAKNYT